MINSGKDIVIDMNEDYVALNSMVPLGAVVSTRVRGVNTPQNDEK